MNSAQVLALMGESVILAGLGLFLAWLYRGNQPILRAIGRITALGLALLVIPHPRPILGGRPLVPVKNNAPQWSPASLAADPIVPKTGSGAVLTMPSYRESRRHARVPEVEVSTIPLEPVVFLWLSGSVLALLWTLFGLVCLAVATRRGEKIPDELAEEVRALSALMGIPQPRISVSHHIPSPFVGGVLRPVLGLPSQWWETTDKRVARAVILHELAHIAARDQIWLLITRLAGIIFWPNALIHLLNGKQEAAAEQLADSRVVSLGVSPTDYARWLVDQHDALRRRGPLPVLSAKGSPSGLKQRVRHLLSAGIGGSARLLPWQWAAISSTCAVAALFAPTIVSAQEEIGRQFQVDLSYPTPAEGQPVRGNSAPGVASLEEGDPFYGPETAGGRQVVLDHLVTAGSPARAAWHPDGSSVASVAGAEGPISTPEFDLASRRRFYAHLKVSGRALADEDLRLEAPFDVSGWQYSTIKDTQTGRELPLLQFDAPAGIRVADLRLGVRQERASVFGVAGTAAGVVWRADDKGVVTARIPGNVSRSWFGIRARDGEGRAVSYLRAQRPVYDSSRNETIIQAQYARTTDLQFTLERREYDWITFRRVRLVSVEFGGVDTGNLYLHFTHGSFPQSREFADFNPPVLTAPTARETVTLANMARLRIRGVTAWDPRGVVSWDMSGRPIPRLLPSNGKPLEPSNGVRSVEIHLAVDGTPNPDILVEQGGTFFQILRSYRSTGQTYFEHPVGQTHAHLTVGVAAGAWNLLATGPGRGRDLKPSASYVPGSATNLYGMYSIPADPEWNWLNLRVVVQNPMGQFEQPGFTVRYPGGSRVQGEMLITSRFGTPRKFWIYSRRYCWARFSDVPLYPVK